MKTASMRGLAGFLAACIGAAPAALAQKQERPRSESPPAAASDLDPKAAARILDELFDRALHGAAGTARPALPGASARKKSPPPPPEPLESTKPAEKATSAHAVLNDLLDASEKAEQQRELKEARKLVVAAQAAMRAGRWSEALRRTREANRLAPDDRAIVELLQTIEKHQARSRAADGEQARARAYLAAALSRGQELLGAERHAEAIDLLGGVVEAARMFPDAESVEMYRRAAQRELDDYRAGVQSGRIASQTTDESDAVPLAAIGVRAPDNLPRLLRGSEGEVPTWYARQKTLLAKPISVDYRMTPLANVFEDLHSRTGCRIVVDDAILKGNALGQERLDLRATSIPAESILQIACLKAGLEYVLMEKGVVATSPARALEYVRQLPQSLRHNWATARVLFPSMNPDKLASAPTARSRPAPSSGKARPDEQTPEHLASGAALQEEIARLLGLDDRSPQPPPVRKL